MTSMPKELPPDRGAESAVAASRAEFAGSALVGSGVAEAPADWAADELLGLPFQFHTIYGTLRDATGVGEKRNAVVWFARGETAPSHGNRKVDRYGYTAAHA